MKKMFSYNFSSFTCGIRNHSGKLITWEYSDNAAIRNDKVIDRGSAKVTEPQAQNLTALGIYQPGFGDTQEWLKARNTYLAGFYKIKS